MQDASLWAPVDRWRAQLIFTRDGVKDCRENVIYILEGHPAWQGVLGADTFSKRIVVRKPSPIGHAAGAVWTPDDDVRFGLWLTGQERLTVRSEDVIARAVAYVARKSPFHPLQEHLHSLAWDQTSRLDHWAADYLGAKATQYVSRVGRYFLISLVRRAFEPGCVMRSVPVLEGKQNIGKSTIARLLAQPWFSDSLFDLSNKDVYQLIQGVWLYEVSELDGFTKAEATRVKAFISSTKDRFRAPYERAPEDHARETCFVATTNAEEYLRDWTGNTRFWPITCGTIELDAFQKVRDQLLAEAVAVYTAGGDPARSHPTREEEEETFRPEQDRRLAMHPWHFVVADWLSDHAEIESCTTNEILKGALHMGAIDMGRSPAVTQIVGGTMKRLGWERRKDGAKGPDGGRAYRWHRPPVQPVAPPAPDEVPF
jgi:putative DNA primase/helicase